MFTTILLTLFQSSTLPIIICNFVCTSFIFPDAEDVTSSANIVSVTLRGLVIICSSSKVL